MSHEYVIIGGGDFAVEIATYLLDVWREKDGQEGAVTDVVAQSCPRFGDFEKALGSTPVLHERLGQVQRLKGKRTVIAVGDPSLRYRFMRELDEYGAQFGTVIHPSAYIAPTATIDAGTVVCPMAFVGPFARLSRNCVLNVGAIVGHDVKVGECAVLSPGADVNGHGLVGEGALLGARAIINPKVGLGAFGKLSAGSVLTRSAGEGFLMHGNPASGRKMFCRP